MLDVLYKSKIQLIKKKPHVTKNESDLNSIDKPEVIAL